MSFYRNLGVPGFIAGGTIIPSGFIKGDTSTGDNYAVQAGAGDAVLGVSQQGQKLAPGTPGADAAIAAETGDPFDAYGPGDFCPITYGGNVTRYQWVKSDAAGKAVAHTTGAAFVGGIAWTGGASGEIGKILVFPCYISL